MIPPRLIRTVPAHTTPEVEQFWDRAREMHAGWELLTLRDPIDPADFPLTAPHWHRCTSGAQRAGLIRLEALLAGGIYIDSDIECYRPFTPLLGCQAFAGWEDPKVVPDAVIGAEPDHPAIRETLRLAIDTVDSGPWVSGPGATTAVLPGRDDVLLLPPGSLYPYHYTEKASRRDADHKTEQPWAFCAHHWHASWL